MARVCTRCWLFLNSAYSMHNTSLHAQDAGGLCHIKFNVDAEEHGSQDALYCALPTVFRSSAVRGLRSCLVLALSTNTKGSFCYWYEHSSCVYSPTNHMHKAILGNQRIDFSNESRAQRNPRSAGDGAPWARYVGMLGRRRIGQACYPGARGEYQALSQLHCRDFMLRTTFTRQPLLGL